MKQTAQIIPIHSRQEAAWNAYISAAIKAQTSLDFRDAHHAGKAFRAFLDSYLSPEQRGSLDGLRR